MLDQKGNITVYYDAACPTCERDRSNYQRLAGRAGENICWVDITGRDEELRAVGIDPDRALKELHLIDQQHNILSEIDAYRLLMSKAPALKPVAWFIGLPLIRPLLSRLYHWQVKRRLKREGRL